MYGGVHHWSTGNSTPFNPDLSQFPSHLLPYIADSPRSQATIGRNQAKKGYIITHWTTLASFTMLDPTKGPDKVYTSRSPGPYQTLCGFIATRYCIQQTSRKWLICNLKRSPKSSTTILIQVSFSPLINITVTAPFRDYALHQLPQDDDGFGLLNAPQQNLPRKLSSLNLFRHLAHDSDLQYPISLETFAGEGTHLWS
jgi:hypothetical protein